MAKAHYVYRYRICLSTSRNQAADHVLNDPQARDRTNSSVNSFQALLQFLY